MERRVQRLEGAMAPGPKVIEPDFTGWSEADIFAWRCAHGVLSFEDVVHEANEGQENRFREAAAESDRLRTEALKAAAAAAPEPASEPAPTPEAAAPEEPPPEKPWWEERAKWRHRGAADYDWKGGVRYECIHEYDPLAAWDEEDGPFADDD
jgi:hypothetical protein